MDVFALRHEVIREYSDYIGSFITIRDPRIRARVDQEMDSGLLWPDPLVQLNPAFEPGDSLDALIQDGTLHPLCRDIFSDKPIPGENRGPLRLHRHQVDGIRTARAGRSYVLTTGTGSGKSLSYIIPIVDHVLRQGSGKGIQAIVVYPMNALANSQIGELTKFLCHGFPEGRPPVTFRRYTGQEKEEVRKEIVANPPDILLTNYVMLELVLTRPNERRLVEAAQGLRFLVFDELHTYRGRQGADVAMLIRRVREACRAPDLLHVGTSATLSGGLTWREQQEDVADVASRVFGTHIDPDSVIGEHLARVTAATPPTRDELVARITSNELPATAEAFRADPLARWIEGSVGLREEQGRLVRCKPRPLVGRDGIALALSEETGLPVEQCTEAIQKALLHGYDFRDAWNRPIFAFRLHQFISKGDRVYASPEAEADRYVTLRGQQFVPRANRTKVLFPLAFCRECGQEFYVVRRIQPKGGTACFEPRELSDRQDEEEEEGGYLYIDSENPWPSAGSDLTDRLPDSWLETRVDGIPRIIPSRQDRIPRPTTVSPDGIDGQGGIRAAFIEAPLLFCPCCKVEYDAHQRSDYGKLSTLGSEGRSSATTILSLSTIRRLRKDQTLEEKARKLLSFTDNRQDASLQAGHFNDFVEVVLLRAALRRAVLGAGSAGLRHDTLIQRVFEALNLPLEVYAYNPNVRFAAREETDAALRRVLAHYVYRDLRRGWRLSSPNLEQAGLLDIAYLSLGDLCADDSCWEGCHEVLVTARPETRERVARVLLDHLRRELALRVDVLEVTTQESIKSMSSQYLIAPWAIDENEDLERSRIAWPRGRQPGDRAWDRGVFVSARGGFGMFLRRPPTFPDAPHRVTRDDSERIILNLFGVLCSPGGLLVEVEKARSKDETSGYQLAASALVWRPGEGKVAHHDPVRVPNAPDAGLKTNSFFVRFYDSEIADLRRLEAREHTAQVQAETREKREEAFRAARLPILYCSPTMELGVDISQLNVVHMRNVPPSPANYAQRSGRAGRSGQPALVTTYCSAGSPHDQYFFHQPDRMVGGAVSTPRLDLANEDLLRAHVHAIWLAESNLSLHSSLTEILDVDGSPPALTPRANVAEALRDPRARDRARVQARLALGPVIQSFLDGHGTVDEWIGRVLDSLPASFDQACKRWRDLYRSAWATSIRQTSIAIDASRPPEDRERARRDRAEAEAQLKLLQATENADFQSDFYSYRYFASEGFLPGYNFPRLPLSAWIPGRRRSIGKDEYLQRPRFLAISEFGPRGIVYHEGSRYVISKAMLPVEGEDASITKTAVQCAECGYLHPVGEASNPDLCERCRARLPQAMDNLFPMRNVMARRRDRITSDEEERMRLGYDIRAGLRYATRGGEEDKLTARLVGPDGETLATLEYGHSATLWRVNLGWRRKTEDAPKGYLLDLETGVWDRSQAEKAGKDAPGEDPTSSRQGRVIPFVEDHRNSLLVLPQGTLSDGVMASLQAALKTAIQGTFQLEDAELAAEPLPTLANRKMILIYEASEGGAGVLRRLVEDRRVLPRLARTALERCHFDPDTGQDLRRAPAAREDCEAACYDCLLSYYNQRDHSILDRQALQPLLTRWMAAEVETSPRPETREEHLDRLLRLCQSELERRWLRFLADNGYNLPSDAQHRFPKLSIQADFYYRDQAVVIFVDGPPHDEMAQWRKDKAQEEALIDAGFATVLRFHHAADWRMMLREFPSVFGQPRIEVAHCDIGFVQGQFEKPGSEPFTESEQRACVVEMQVLMVKVLEPVALPPGFRFQVELDGVFPGTISVEMMLTIVGAAAAVPTLVGAMPIILHNVGRVLEGLSTATTGAATLMGDCGRWFKGAAVRMLPAPLPPLVDGSYQLPEGSRPGCFGANHHLDKRTRRCRTCGYLIACEQTARPPKTMVV